MALVRRNDFNSKFQQLTGKEVEISENQKQVSFQDHFFELIQKTLKIIKRPIDTDEMRPFHLSKMSKIKEMLDMKNVVKKHETNETPKEMPLKEQISTEKTESSIESDV